MTRTVMPPSLPERSQAREVFKEHSFVVAETACQIPDCKGEYQLRMITGAHTFNVVAQPLSTPCMPLQL